VGIEAGLARAWREASRGEPPAALDDAIRAAARKAVYAGPRPAGASPFGGRWRVPLSVAAVLVVSATITLLVAERDKHGSRSLHEQAAPPPPASLREFFGSRAAPAEPELPAQSTEQGAPPAPSLPTPQPQRELAGNAQPELAERKAIGSAAGTGLTSADKAQAPADAQRAERSAQQAPFTEVAPSEARHDEAEAVAGAPAAAPALPRAADRLRDVAPAVADEPAGGLTKRETRSAVRAKESVAEEARVPPPQAQEPARKAAPPRAEPSAFPATPGAAALPEGDAAADTENLEPKAWLERILELRRRGKLGEADKSLKAFRARYPDYPLPAELNGPR
jgi:hypothetical protein